MVFSQIYLLVFVCPLLCRGRDSLSIQPALACLEPQSQSLRKVQRRQGKVKVVPAPQPQDLANPTTDVPEHGVTHELQPATMATAAAGHAALVTGSASSFGKFRVTQFVDNAPRPANARTDHHQAPLVSASRDADRDVQMAQASYHPPPGQNPDRTPSVAPARVAPQDHGQPYPSPNRVSTLEVGNLASNPMLEGVLGPNKDGRVRNPVPSKLKGKTDNKKGNFGVMHMGVNPGKKNEVPGRDSAAERDAAARRTSENTASRARAAQQEKYVPPKRRGLETAMKDGQAATNFESPLNSAPRKEDHRQRARPMAPDETKYEQARLLTLLRSINPITVVDQICKAVAYFGGIPDAPPPEDGIFPESANTRETGALFIGWLSEIFPDLSKSPSAAKIQETPPSTAKRGRGRPPRLSKVTLTSEDKGIPNGPHSGSNGYGYGQVSSAPVWTLPQSLSLSSATGSNANAVRRQETHSPFHQDAQLEIQPPSTSTKQLRDEIPATTTSTSKRGRGRPKGSKNKGKTDPQRVAQAPILGHIDHGRQEPLAGDAASRLPRAQGQTANGDLGPVPSSSTSVPILGGQTDVTKLPQNVSYSDKSWQSDSRKKQVEPLPSLTSVDELSPEERAVLEAFRNHGAQAVRTITSSETPMKAPGTGLKRKRAASKLKDTAAPTLNLQGANLQTVQTVMTLPPSSDGSIVIPKDAALQWVPVDTSTPTAPPAKRHRPRKPNVPGTNEPISPNHAAASMVSSATPPIAPSTIPDSAATSSHQSVAVSRAPADGLEAHYERFANLQQQNGRSHTPSITPQQQHQHQNPPQQPQSQQQQPRPKSQQSGQREDQSMTQVSSARPSLTFYGQRSRGSSHSHQYPSHQPSQLYGGHQASPPMGSNSYRTSSKHTLGQASPQFPQSENAGYRTDNPHTVPQASPSFSHGPDNNYRTASNLPQTSPSFSQAETSYRTASTHTHTLTQPSTSFSPRAPSQAQSSHQSHYGHFPDASYVDLPTLESLGHSGGGGTANASMSSGGYGQGIGIGVGTSRPGNNTLYGTSSGLSNNTFDTGTNDLLRPSRSGSNSAYNSTPGLSNAFDTGTSELEMRERLLRGLGRR